MGAGAWCRVRVAGELSWSDIREKGGWVGCVRPEASGGSCFGATLSGGEGHLVASVASWSTDAMGAVVLQAAYDEDTAKQMWDYAAELTGLQIDPSLS
eukprot:356469-Chlamydomonas_euryale.AAC.3